MTERPFPEADKTYWRAQLPMLLLFLVLPSVIELVLTAADHGWLATQRLRTTAYQNGAFWTGLLGNWRPNYPGQPVTMFLTYSFLHAGLWHLTGNMMALIVLMQMTAGALRGWRLSAVYVVSAVGGALGFALLGAALNPMVGASGALFGLAGAWRWLEWRQIEGAGRRALTVLRDVVIMVALNALMWLAQDRALAWEAHLGGFAAGVAAMAALPRRRGDQ